MSDKTNDEKLRILQERLAQIKQKKDTPTNPIQLQEEVIKVPKTERTSISFRWLKYIALLGTIGYGGFYTINNIDFNSLTSNKPDKKIDLVEKELEYNLGLNGDNIAIVATFEDEISAKGMVNDLKVKGFKADCFYLPNKSNSTKEVYKVFIGPYENEEEANQWTKNIESETEKIKL